MFSEIGMLSKTTRSAQYFFHSYALLMITIAEMAQGEKWNFLSVLSTWKLTCHWPFSTNPVEDGAKCHTHPIFGSILYRICGEQSMKCQNSYTGHIRNFIFHPVCANQHLYIYKNNKPLEFQVFSASTVFPWWDCSDDVLYSRHLNLYRHHMEWW